MNLGFRLGFVWVDDKGENKEGTHSMVSPKVKEGHNDNPSENFWSTLKVQHNVM